MGIVDYPVIDLIGKVRSWVGALPDIVPDSLMSFIGDSIVCSGCGERLGLSSYRQLCLSCGKLFCRKCMMTGGFVVMDSRAGQLPVCCRYCHRAADEHRDELQQTAVSSEIDRPSSLSRCSSDRLDRLGESQHIYSPQPVSSSTFRSFEDDEDEGCELSQQYFSPLSEFSQDTSDIDSICVSTSNEFCSFRSANSSPLESPSRSRRFSQDSVSSLPPKSNFYNEGYPCCLPKNDEDLDELLENSNESMYQNFPVGDVEETKEFTQHVDFENHELWHPPPAGFEDDGGETSFFDYSDEDDDVGDSARYFTSSCFCEDADEYPTREPSGVAHKEVLKSAVQGHFKALVCQLLKGEGVNSGNENDGHGWLDVVCSLAWHAATYVKPDTSRGGSMDPGEYVKVKCISSGNPSDSILVKGVVCTKNLKHKRMVSQHKNPRVLLLGGALEYHKVTNKLASINTLLEQENDHMKMALDKIEALRPNVLLVEKSVSTYAQERLLAKKEISLVLNVKRSLLERIARCTGAQIAPSVDGVTSARLGHCEMFRIERVFEVSSSLKHPKARSSKTLMFFEGCPRRLGCTVLLRGTCLEELKKVKHVVQYATFAAYHLSLETSFLADEGASLPKIPLGSPPMKVIKDASCIPNHFGLPVDCGQDLGDVSGDNSLYFKCDVECLSCPDSLHLNQDTKILEPSSEQHNCKYTSDIGNSDNFIGFSKPILQNRREKISNYTTNMYLVQSGYAASGFQHDKTTNSTRLPCNSLNKGPLSQELVASRSNLSSDRFLGSDEQDRINVSGSVESPREYFSTADNQQSILVSFSSTCITKGTICEGSQLFRIKFYGSFDKPLGRYLRDDLFDQAFRCHSCRGPTDAHVRCYTHQQGSLSISVKRLLSKRLPGERDGKIWMWHRCLKCEPKNGVPPAACRVVMSDAAWGLSFGKFLELSFSNHATANRVANCGHSLQRDCLRFYGFGSMVAVFHYSPVDILSVHLPSFLLDFTCQIQQEWLKQEAKMISNKIDILHEEISGLLETIRRKITLSEDETLKESIIKKITELKDLLYIEKYDYHILLQPFTVENIQHFPSRVDVLELNRMRRTLLTDSFAWNRRLCLLYAFSEGKGALLRNDVQALDIPSKEGMLGSGHENSLGFPTPTSLFRMPNFSKQHDEFGVNIWECNTNNMIEMDLSIESAEGYVGRAGLNVISQKICTSDDCPTNTEAGSTTSVDNSASSTTSLSDKIDLAWTGSGHLMMNQSKGTPNSDLVRQIKFPLRVYSFDSALRIRKRVRGGYFPLSLHAAPVKSLGSSECVSNMVRDSIPNMRRAYSQSSPRAIQNIDVLNNRMPACILPASFLVSDGARLMLPQTGLVDIVVAVFDNEPTSIVSYALTSKEYCDYVTTTDNNSFTESFTSRQLVSYSQPENGFSSSRSFQARISDPKETHFRMTFDDDSLPGDKVKFSVTCYFAKQFDLLRKKCCPSELDYIRSLCRCKRWNAQGGKSNAYFAKSLDDRFIIKQVTRTELDSFEDFAPEFFKYMTESISSGSPTCLSKILGIYQVNVKHLNGGKEWKMDFMVMENLFFDRNISRVYDLKGSLRSRYNSDTSGTNKVLLDMNLLETLGTKPIFLGSKAKRRLERAVWNDTSFLASVDVMDYSLLVGIDDERKELVIGIIDFMRQYTWDKHLETWVKASGILGGPRDESPTVISPVQYKKRFRKAMSKYFLTVPD